MARAYGTVSTLRRERKEQTRENILAAAADVFRESGLAGGSIEEVTNRANVSRQTFYNHFESKEQLLVEIMRSEEVRMLAEYHRLAKMTKASTGDYAEWAENFINLGCEHKAIVLLLMRTVPFETEQGQLPATYYETVIALLAGTYPAFAAVSADKAPVAHARALLIFFELETILRLALIQANYDLRSACMAWAESFAAFTKGARAG